MNVNMCSQQSVKREISVLSIHSTIFKSSDPLPYMLMSAIHMHAFTCTCNSHNYMYRTLSQNNTDYIISWFTIIMASVITLIKGLYPYINKAGIDVVTSRGTSRSKTSTVRVDYRKWERKKSLLVCVWMTVDPYMAACLGNGSLHCCSVAERLNDPYPSIDD